MKLRQEKSHFPKLNGNRELPLKERVSLKYQEQSTWETFEETTEDDLLLWARDKCPEKYAQLLETRLSDENFINVLRFFRNVEEHTFDWKGFEDFENVWDLFQLPSITLQNLLIEINGMIIGQLEEEDEKNS